MVSADGTCVPPEGPSAPTSDNWAQPVRYSLLLGIAPDDPEQSKRFIETAEEVGADRDDEALESDS